MFPDTNNLADELKSHKNANDVEDSNAVKARHGRISVQIKRLRIGKRHSELLEKNIEVANISTLYNSF